MLFEYKKTTSRRAFVLLTSALISSVIATTSYAVEAVTSSEQTNTPTTEAMTEPLEAMKDDVQVLGWANEAFMVAYRYNWVNYKDARLIAQHYFTKDAWASLQTLQENDLQKVIKDKLILSSGLSTAPIIIKKGIKDGVMTYMIQFNATIIYQSKSKMNKRSTSVTMMVARTNNKNSVRGLEIVEFTEAAD